MQPDSVQQGLPPSSVQLAHAADVRHKVALGDKVGQHGLRQVLAAIVHNALQHTPVESAIEVHGTRTGGSIVIDIIDHGPGMNEHTAARAFERFFRGDQSRTRQSGGSGLGLAIAQSIVHAHGGAIGLTTSVQHGSTFRIMLPVTPEA